MNYLELKKIAESVVGEALSSVGFRLVSPGVWNRFRGQEINVIEFQKHSAVESFCVNLGVHLTFLPRAGVEAVLDVEKVVLTDCEFKFRLTAKLSEADQWWPISQASLDDVAVLVKGGALVVFDSYRMAQLSEIDIGSIETGNTGILAVLTKVRAGLLLARLHEQLGNLDKCAEAARAGLRLAGMAVGPKMALKEILKRCESGG